VRTQGNRCNGTASSALPRPGQALAPAGARQTLNRPGCEYVSPATSPGSSIIHAGEAEVQIPPGCSLTLFRLSGLFAKSCPHPNPSPVNGRGARNASVTGRLRAGGVPAPLPFTGEGLGIRRSLADCGLAECQPLSRLRERGPECVGHWQTAGWRSASPSPVYGRGVGVRGSL